MKALRYVVSAVIVICIGGYAAFWYYQADKIKKGVDATLTDKETGLQFTYKDIRTRGFPLSIQLVYDDPKLENANLATSFALDGSFLSKWSLFGDLQETEMKGKLHMAVPVGEEKTLH